MTRQHFTAIAETFARTKPSENHANIPLIRQWEYDVRQMAVTLSSFNPRFDRDKFLAACGCEDN